MVSSNTMEIVISNASGRIQETINLPPKATVSQLKLAIARDCKSFRKLNPLRQRLALADKTSLKSSKRGGNKAIVLDDDQRSLISYGFQSGNTIILKDLGPQISWRTVFFLEYLGPLLIHQAYLYNYVYRQGHALSLVQLLSYLCITFHFIKREYETLFVHRFSHATMPLRNLFKNSAHYWLLSGVGIGHFLYSSSFADPDWTRSSPGLLYALLGFFIFSELANFYTHIILRDLRPAGSTARAIPRGFTFNLVSCPNYFHEICAWLAVSLLAGLPSCWFFTAVASVQMGLWALKKHSRYQQEFPDYPKARRAMIPFLC